MTPQDVATKATPRFKYPLDRPVKDADVVAAISLIGKATSLTELKALAYACHIGVLTTAEFSSHLGNPAMVLDTVLAFIATLQPVDSARAAELFVNGIAGYHGMVFGNSQDEGWAFTLFDALHDSHHADWRKLFVPNDPALIGVRWATQGLLDTSEASDIVSIWAALDDALHVAVAGSLVLASVDSEIAGRVPMIDISGLPALPRAIIGGRVMGNLLMGRRTQNQLADFARRRDELIARFAPLVASWMQTPADLRTFVRSGTRNQEELIAFLHTLPLQARAKRAAEAEGNDLLSRAFKRVETRVELDERQLMYVAGWMINPLANTALAIKLGPDRFEELLDNLAFDEYAYDFNHALYLNDRIRAILLCAIGAIVANKNNESTIGDKAQEAAKLLCSMPTGSVTVFGNEALRQLESEFGITLPSQQVKSGLTLLLSYLQPPSILGARVRAASSGGFAFSVPHRSRLGL